MFQEREQAGRATGEWVVRASVRMPEEETAPAGMVDVVLEGGEEDVVIDVAPDSAAKAASDRKSAGGFDWGDEMEDADQKDDERFVEIEAKIAVENDKARARAERFSVEYVEPKLEVILTREEVNIFRTVTNARKPLPEGEESVPRAQKERRGRGRGTHQDVMGITAGEEIKGEVRDRDYTEALLAKVPPPSPVSSDAGPKAQPCSDARRGGGARLWREARGWPPWGVSLAWSYHAARTALVGTEWAWGLAPLLVGSRLVNPCIEPTLNPKP